MKRKPPKGKPIDISNTPLSKWIGLAIDKGAQSIEIEHNDSQELICAIQGMIGFGIGSIDSSSKEAIDLRKQMYALRRRKRIALDGQIYSMRLEIFGSFGEDAFRIEFEPI